MTLYDSLSSHDKVKLTSTEDSLFLCIFCYLFYQSCFTCEIYEARWDSTCSNEHCILDLSRISDPNAFSLDQVS